MAHRPSSSSPTSARPTRSSSPPPMPASQAAGSAPEATSAASTGLRKRTAVAAEQRVRDKKKQEHDVQGDDNHSDDMSFTKRNQWMVLAVASGACAAFNGVFAKLTTNDLTTTIAKGVSHLFGMDGGHVYIEVVVRVIFFSLNLIFNGVMWTLFTQALAKGNSTTQVSIMNTSTNFMFTALLGFVIFSESLPPLWWLGAAMLVAGNVIIGRKDAGEEDDEEEEVLEEGEYRDEEDAETGRRRNSEDEDVALIGDL